MTRMMTRLLIVIALFAAMAAPVRSASAIDDEHYEMAREMIDRAIAYLRTQQDEATGGFNINPDGPSFPGITGLIVHGMLMHPDIHSDDPTVSKAVDYILANRQTDGGLYDRILPNYNTALCLSALARVEREGIDEVIRDAQEHLKRIQWSDQTLDDGTVITPDHPYYGGAGYGSSGRPDNSNLNFMLQALEDSGVDCKDPAVVRAMTFLRRTQMLDEVNDMPYADGSSQGGFIYATSPNKENIGIGESKAGEIEETLDDGTTVSRLRAYGSMTYAGFKSYVYAQLDRDDPAVVAAWEWIRRNYTLEENPGIGQQGYYYYLVTFSRAMDAWGETTITPVLPDGSEGQPRDWANDLIDALYTRQREDGSWANANDRWMEGDPVLVTAYCLLALQYAID